MDAHHILDCYGCNVSIVTKENDYYKAIDDLLERCAAAGIDLILGPEVEFDTGDY